MNAQGLRWFCRAAGCLAALLISAMSLPAEDSLPAGQVGRASEQVREALQREVYGLAADRAELLTAAIAADPQAKLPRWHQGQIQTAAGEWRSVDRPVAAAEGRLWREYAALRNEKQDDADSHKALADWCRKHDLPAQERAHLIRSLTLDPKQAELRKRLNLVKVGNQWYEPATVEREERRQKAAKEANEHWFPILTKLAPQLGSPDEKKHEAARELVLAIRDIGALPVLQSVIASRGEEEQLLVLKVAGGLPEMDATRLLAWLAAESRSEKVRELAAHLLKSREPADYVPLLLSEMYSPIQTKVESTVGPNGSVALRRSFVREGADRVELFVADGRFVSVNPHPNNVGFFSGMAELHNAVNSAVSVSEANVAEQNRLTQLRNERITAALVGATGTNLPAQPDAWWKWWVEVNEVEQTDGKKLVTGYTYTGTNLIGRSRPTWIGLAPPAAITRSCFNAGTPVWTDQGPIAIERIRIGDLVLARDVETGELAYKPVLLTTVRGKRQLTKLTAGTDTLQATGGHLFWVSGSGWVRAKELQPGQVLHGASAPASVASVEQGIVAETYNLVVDDYHNYFVGQQKLLAHDNTPRLPTRMIVPGLQAE